MKKQKEKDEECPRERTFINRGNNNKRYRKNVRTHTYIYVRTCNMLTIELMPTLLKLSRLSIRRTSTASRQTRERKLVDQLERHVRLIATIESNSVMYFSNKQYLHEAHRKKKEMTIDR